MATDLLIDCMPTCSCPLSQLCHHNPLTPYGAYGATVALEQGRACSARAAAFLAFPWSLLIARCDVVINNAIRMMSLHRRLGTCLLGLGRSFEAEKLLQTASDRFTTRLGADNPVASEARLAVAIANVRQLLPFQA